MERNRPTTARYFIYTIRRLNGDVVHEAQSSSWNEVIRQAAEAGVNLTNCDFRNLDLRGLDLSRTNANLSGSDFSGAKLVNANFTGAALDQVNFADTTISGTKFIGCRLAKANFTEAVGKGTNFTGSDMSSAILRDSKLRRPNFTEVTFGTTETKKYRRERRPSAGASVFEGVYSNTEMNSSDYAELRWDKGATLETGVVAGIVSALSGGAIGSLVNEDLLTRVMVDTNLVPAAAAGIAAVLINKSMNDKLDAGIDRILSHVVRIKDKMLTVLPESWGDTPNSRILGVLAAGSASGTSASVSVLI